MNEDEGLHIKCHICDTKYVKESVPIELVEGSGQFEDSDAYKCPKCGEEMVIVSFIEKHQTDVIEKILRHCDLWREPIPRPPPKITSPIESTFEEPKVIESTFEEPKVDYLFFDTVCA